MTESLFQRGKKEDAPLDLVPPTCPLFAPSPYLYDCIKTTKTEKGKLVKGCTVRIQFHLTDVQVCVTDPEANLYAYLTLDPFKGLAEALEEVLAAQPLPWKDSRGKRS